MSGSAAWLRTPGTCRDLTFLGLVVAVLYLLTGNHPALGSSNRYAESCREMVELGEWMVPHLGYVPYFEKPILTYWLGAASQWLFGGGNLATNLPAGLAALVSMFATYALGVRLRDRVFGLAAALLLLGCALFLGFASTLTTDPIIAACLAVCWWTWWRWEEERRAASAGADRWLWGFWTALGLAFLAKGPVAVVLAGLAVGGYALLAGGLRGMFATLWAMHPLRGSAILLAINLPWSIVVWLRDPRFLEFFYVRINFQAFFDGSINHPGPWWYYGPVLAGYLAPFTPVAVPALAIGLWRALVPALRAIRLGGINRLPDAASLRPRLYLAGVVVLPLLFLSVSASKLGTYPLPLLPAVVLLALDALWNPSVAQRRWWAGLLIAFGGALLIALISAPWIVVALEEAREHDLPTVIHVFGQPLAVGHHRDLGLENVAWQQLPLALSALALLAAGVLWCVIEAGRHRLRSALLGLGAGFTALAVVMLPRIDGFIIDLDGSRLMEVVRARGGPADPVILHQDEVHDYELVHALRRRTAIFGHARELGMGHLAEVLPRNRPFPPKPYDTNGENLPENRWLLSRQRLQEVWNRPQRLWLVCEQNVVDDLRASGLPVHLIDRARIVLLVSNQP